MEVPRQESGRGGEREADSLKNSQCPAKAYWGPDVVHVLRRHARLWKGQWSTGKVLAMPKSCAVEKEFTKEIPENLRCQNEERKRKI